MTRKARIAFACQFLRGKGFKVKVENGGIFYKIPGPWMDGGFIQDGSPWIYWTAR